MTRKDAIEAIESGDTERLAAHLRSGGMLDDLPVGELLCTCGDTRDDHRWGLGCARCGKCVEFALAPGQDGYISSWE